MGCEQVSLLSLIFHLLHQGLALLNDLLLVFENLKLDADHATLPAWSSCLRPTRNQTQRSTGNFCVLFQGEGAELHRAFAHFKSFCRCLLPAAPQ